MNVMMIAWLVVAVVFGIIELMTLSLTMIWFSIGALCAMVLSIFTDNIYIQIVVFCIVAYILLYVVTKKLIKMDKSKTGLWKSIDTNVDAIVGEKGFVIVDITSQKNGIVKVKSEEWSAQSIDMNETIQEGTEIIVNKVEGVKLIVSKYVG